MSNEEQRTAIPVDPPLPATEEPADRQPTSSSSESAGEADRKQTGANPAADQASATSSQSIQPTERPELSALRQAKDESRPISGRVIGWNRGGLHVVVNDLTAFCPRSEMEIGAPKSPDQYLDRSFEFVVLKIQKRGRRIVLSRAQALKQERSRQRAKIRDMVKVGAELDGKVTSVTDFGAFVDLGGVQGLVHVSEISHKRIDRPDSVLHAGQDLKVKVLKVDKGGKRISLSIRALEPDPWRQIRQRYPEGTTVKGRVEKVTRHGAFIELEPGLTGLLPASTMSLPRDASPTRVYAPGRLVTVQVVAVDERRHRISLAPEDSAVTGTRKDYQAYLRSQESEVSEGFNALAEAFRRLDR